MSGDEPDPRAEALERIDAVERGLGALAEQAGRLRDEVSALRASVTAIDLQAPAAADDRLAEAESDDRLAGARLVALDLVLAGVARDEAVLQMAAEYPGVDVAALVDEALAAQR